MKGQTTVRKGTLGAGRTHPSLSIFPTELGWMGLVGHGSAVEYLSIGHTSEAAVRTALPLEYRDLNSEDWSPALRELLERYARGESVSFAEVTCTSVSRTEFQKRVLAVTQSLPYGATVTYGQLAELAGRPGAARAVGTTMARNRVPLIVPCHRVIGSGGKLGGYSAAQGLAFKKRLLDMEASAARQR